MDSKLAEFGFSIVADSGGSFDIRKLNGTKISPGISFKKLELISKRKSLIQERREATLPPHA